MKYYKDAGLKAVLKITENSCLIASYENEFIEHLPQVSFFAKSDLVKYPRQGLTEISVQEFDEELKRVEKKIKAKEEQSL